ncbi:hypothetical protein GOV03_04975 [Candidatus Woesearchaeota archaeon]|nr:hypothetical protein [Candidatus Woesearchaeota archaeon]
MEKSKKTLHQWTCPHEKVFLLRPETILLGVFVLLIFIFSYLVSDQMWIPAIILSIVFILIFIIVTHSLRILYPIQEKYHVTHSGISIHRKTKEKTSKVHIKYPEIKIFKLDKLFHGGRLETERKRHSICFNTKQEIEKLERILKKKIKKR